MVPFHSQKGHTSTSKKVYSALPKANRATMILLQTPVQKKERKKEKGGNQRGIARCSALFRLREERERRGALRAGNAI